MELLVSWEIKLAPTQSIDTIRNYIGAKLDYRCDQKIVWRQIELLVPPKITFGSTESIGTIKHYIGTKI